MKQHILTTIRATPETIDHIAKLLPAGKLRSPVCLFGSEGVKVEANKMCELGKAYGYDQNDELYIIWNLFSLTEVYKVFKYVIFTEEFLQDSIGAEYAYICTRRAVESWAKENNKIIAQGAELFMEDPPFDIYEAEALALDKRKRFVYVCWVTKRPFLPDEDAMLRLPSVYPGTFYPGCCV